MTEPEQGSAEAVYVSAMVGEMMQRVLQDALVDLARNKGAAYLDMFKSVSWRAMPTCFASGRTIRLPLPACCALGS